MQPHDTTNDSPKLCECGCGQPTPPAKATNHKYGLVKGQPTRFVRGHENRNRRNRTPEQRFWAKVNVGPFNECWEWTASGGANGYGIMRIEGKPKYTHRFSWELHYGAIPEGVFVCHKCDNPGCVNPYHLFLGSPADNMHDMMKKGRKITPSRKGNKNGRAKLTEDDVRQVRQLYAQGVTPKTLSKRFGVTSTNIHDIVNRRTWAHI